MRGQSRGGAEPVAVARPRVFCGCAPSSSLALCSSAALGSAVMSRNEKFFRPAKSPHQNTNQTTARSLWRGLRLQAQVSGRRGASAEHACVERVLLLSGGGISERRDSENGSVHFSLLLHRQPSSGGAPSLPDPLISQSQNTCCLPDR